MRLTPDAGRLAVGGRPRRGRSRPRLVRITAACRLIGRLGTPYERAKRCYGRMRRCADSRLRERSSFGQSGAPIVRELTPAGGRRRPPGLRRRARIIYCCAFSVPPFSVVAVGAQLPRKCSCHYKLPSGSGAIHANRCGKCSWHEVFRRVLAKSRHVERHPEQYVPQGLSIDGLWPRTGATNRRH